MILNKLQLFPSIVTWRKCSLIFSLIETNGNRPVPRFSLNRKECFVAKSIPDSAFIIWTLTKVTGSLDASKWKSARFFRINQDWLKGKYPNTIETPQLGGGKFLSTRKYRFYQRFFTWTNTFQFSDSGLGFGFRYLLPVKAIYCARANLDNYPVDFSSLFP